MSYQNLLLHVLMLEHSISQKVQEKLLWLLFCSLGRKFDKNGDIVKEWWSKSSLMEFNKKSECIEEQYSKYKVQGRYPVRSVFMPCSLELLINFLAVRNDNIFWPNILEYRSKARYNFVSWLYNGLIFHTVLEELYSQ